MRHVYIGRISPATGRALRRGCQLLKDPAALRTVIALRSGLLDVPLESLSTSPIGVVAFADLTLDGPFNLFI